MFDSRASAYEILGVEPDATQVVIKRAYLRRLRQTHPDTGGDAAQFQQVQEAWQLIGTVEARALYRPGVFVKPSPARPTAGARGPAGRPRARSYGHPGGRLRQRYLELIREWAGRGVVLDDPYAPDLLRSAPEHLRDLYRMALAEESAARMFSELGIAYTVWHAATVANARSGLLVPHILLGPSGLFALASWNLDAPVRAKRGELIGEALAGRRPMGELSAAVRDVSRAAKVKFNGLALVLPDAVLPEPRLDLGRNRGVPSLALGSSALAEVLRFGLAGAPPISGAELFDIRTRLQQTLILD